MPKKAKPSSKSPEQKALEAEVRKELRRVQRLERSLLQRGYTLPSTFVPPLPKQITPATLRKYQRITPETAYKKAVYVMPEGVAIKGYVRRKQERVEAARKAAQTRAEQVIIRNAAENLRMLEYFVSKEYDKSAWSEELKQLKNEDRGILQDALQTLDDRCSILLGDDAAFCQHLGVCHAALNILPVHPLVELDGGVEVIYQAVGLLAKPSAPQFHNLFLSFVAIL